MVLAYKAINDGRFSFVESSPAEKASIWWRDASLMASDFFFVMQEPEIVLYPQPLGMIIARLEEIYADIALMQTPPQVYLLRQYLFAAMNDLITGYKEYLINGDALATAYMRSAQFEFQFMQMELQELRNKHLLA